MKIEKIKIFLKNFFSSWQVAKMYEITHPLFIDSIDKAYTGLREVFANESQLTVGIFGDELVSENHVFFELSKQSKSAISQLKDAEIEKISFSSMVEKEELVNFVASLINFQKEKVTFPEMLISQGVRNISVGGIGAGSDKNLPEKGTKGDKSSLAQYNNCLDAFPRVLDSLFDQGTVDLLNLNLITNSITASLLSSYNIFLQLSLTKKHDVSTFGHLINVSILSVSFASKLGLKKEDCLAIGIAALFHDIGKLYITRRIIQKPGQLDKDEFFKIKSHTVLGAELLLKHTKALTYLPVVVSFEHHLGYNLGGYPKVSSSYKPHLASLIVSICDVYDALTQRRSYKRDYPPDMIYRIMIKDRGSKFSPELLDIFFRTMGVWPCGTIVELDDGKIAIVRRQTDDIFNPLVEVISEKEKLKLDLSQAKKDFSIRRSLNPLSEGKKYLNFL